MARSIIYRSALLYRLLMVALYGRSSRARHRAIADVIPDGSEAVELCCGPGILYSTYLRPRNVRYTGLDINEGFIARIAARGATGIVRDLSRDEPLPAADYVIMQASLYHFLPDGVQPVLKRMTAAARKAVIVAEPVVNVASSQTPIVAWLAKVLTDPGTGKHTHRFDEAGLDAAFKALGLPIERTFFIQGGREKVDIVNVQAAALGAKNEGAR